MINLKKVNMTLDKKVLDNGLTIYVLKNENRSKYNVSFFTRFGALISSFEKDGTNYKIPYGTAHFLEHKMFEQEDGIDPFNFFSNNGASGNAFTSKMVTNYLFSGFDKLKENLLYLLEYVGNPYFTDLNVEKEKGIIQQELKMINDNIDYFEYDMITNNMFSTPGYKIPVIGTKESIDSITKEDLYSCYNNFYAPNNMTLFVSGNISMDEILDIVNESDYSKKEAKVFSFDEEIEPVSINKSLEIFKKDVHEKRATVAYKIPISNLDVEKLHVYLGFSLDGIFRTINEEIEVLFDKEIIAEKEIECSMDILGRYICLYINSNSKKTEELIEFIKKEIKKPLSKEDFELQVKTYISEYLYLSDNVDSMNGFILNKIIYNDKYIDRFDLVDKLSYEEYVEYINNVDFNNNSVLIIDCKNK